MKHVPVGETVFFFESLFGQLTAPRVALVLNDARNRPGHADGMADLAVFPRDVFAGLAVDEGVEYLTAPFSERPDDNCWTYRSNVDLPWVMRPVPRPVKAP